MDGRTRPAASTSPPIGASQQQMGGREEAERGRHVAIQIGEVVADAPAVVAHHVEAAGVEDEVELGDGALRHGPGDGGGHSRAVRFRHREGGRGRRRGGGGHRSGTGSRARAGRANQGEGGAHAGRSKVAEERLLHRRLWYVAEVGRWVMVVWSPGI